MEPFSLPLDEQVDLVQMVERNDLAAIAREHRTRGATLWTALLNAEHAPRYPNQGTLVHWAVWARHFDFVTMAVAAGADLSVRGVGCWMNGKTSAEYAALLDEKANHRFYDHAQEFAEAQCGGNQGAAAMRIAELVQEAAKLDLEPLACSAAHLESDHSVQTMVHNMVERHCLGGLSLALRYFGARRLATALVGPENNPFRNRGTVAHWAVWYQHWQLLRWMVAHGCFDPTVTGVGGGWLRDKTAVEFADFLDQKCNHPFYGHRIEVEAALAVAPATTPTDGDSTVLIDALDGTAENASRQAACCCICLTSPATHMISPCRHLCVCGAECKEGLLMQHSRRNGRCPICRTDITSIDEVFMV